MRPKRLSSIFFETSSSMRLYTQTPQLVASASRKASAHCLGSVPPATSKTSRDSAHLSHRHRSNPSTPKKECFLAAFWLFGGFFRHRTNRKASGWGCWYMSWYNVCIHSAWWQYQWKKWITNFIENHEVSEIWTHCHHEALWHKASFPAWTGHKNPAWPSKVGYGWVSRVSIGIP